MSRPRRRSSVVDPLSRMPSTGTALSRTTTDNSLAEHDFAASLHLPDLSRAPSTRSAKGRTQSIGGRLRHDTIDELDEQPVPKPFTAKEASSTSLPEDQTTTSEPSAQQETEELAESKPEAKRFTDTVFFKVSRMFLRVYVIVFAAFMGILSIYWGSLYDRMSHVHNLHYLVVIDDTAVDGLQPLVANTLNTILSYPEVAKLGTFHIYNSTSPFPTTNNNSQFQEIERQVHHQKYWGAFYVPANATLDYFNALTTANASFNSSMVTFVYETGRDLQTIPGYVLTTANTLQKLFAMTSVRTITAPLLGELSSEQQLAVADEAPGIISSLSFAYSDITETSRPIIVGPSQLGFIYILVLSFHQFNFAANMHTMIREKLHLNQYMVYHICTSQGAYLVMSLVYCAMTQAFQVPVTKTFGRSGFLVQWSFVFLTMSALGGLNENAAIQIFARNRAYIGFWIVFFLVINLSPVLSPIALMNPFYRYGYAMPMYNGYELAKVVFFNTWKGHIGRNIGILLAWIVFANILLPFNMGWARNYVRRHEQAAKEAIQKS